MESVAAAFPGARVTALEPPGGPVLVRSASVPLVAVSQEGMLWYEWLAPGSFNLPAMVRRYRGSLDIGALEASFVKAAGPYSRRKGIGYDAWRAAGVEPRVLKAAGIGRGQ